MQKIPCNVHRLPYLILTVFIAQFVLWRSVIFVDSEYWLNKMGLLGWELKNFQLTYRLDIDPSHPGTFFLMVTQLFRLIGFSSSYSLLITEILLGTILITVLGLFCYIIFPNKLWWIGAGGTFIFNNFAYYSNPVDIITSELVAIAFVCVLWHFREKNKTPFLVSVILGTSLGLAIASRIHVSIFLGLLIFFCLFFLINKKRLALIMVASVLSSWIFIPYLWQNPIKFLAIFSYTSPLYGSSTIYLKHAYHISLMDLIDNAPLAFTGFLLAIIFLFLPSKKIAIEIPKKFLLFFLASTTLTTGLIMQSNMVDIRFFYPVIFLCQIFLPYFLIKLVNILHEKRMFPSLCRHKYLWLILVFLENCASLLFIAFILLYFGFMYEKTLLLILQIQFIFLIVAIAVSNTYFSENAP